MSLFELPSNLSQLLSNTSNPISLSGDTSFNSNNNLFAGTIICSEEELSSSSSLSSSDLSPSARILFLNRDTTATVYNFNVDNLSSPCITPSSAASSSSSSPSSSPEESFPSFIHSGSGVQSLLVILLGLMMVSTVIGNLLVCLSVILVRKLRHPSNYLLISLAVSDLCVATLVMPLALYYELSGEWTLGDTFCDIWISFDVTSCTASILNLCMISIDRYLAITQPLTYCVKRTTKRMLVFIISVWLFSCLISIPPLIIFGNDYGTKSEPRCAYSQNILYQLYATLGAFYIPLIVMIILYYKIYVAAKKVVDAELRAQVPNNGTGVSVGGGGGGSSSDVGAGLSPQHSRHLHHPQFHLMTTGSSNWSPGLENGHQNESSEDLNSRTEKVTKLVSSNLNLIQPHIVESTVRLDENGIIIQGDHQEIVTKMSLDTKDTSSSSLLEIRIDPSEFDSVQQQWQMHHQQEAKAMPSVTGDLDESRKAAEKMKMTIMNAANSDQSRVSFGKVSWKMSDGNVTDEKENNLPLMMGSTTGSRQVRCTKLRRTTTAAAKKRSWLDKSDHQVEKQGAQKLLTSSGQQSSNLGSSQKRRISSVLKERKASITLGVIMTAFTACWLPFFILALLRPFGLVKDIPHWATSFALWLGFANSMLNPIIYVTFHQDFRQAFRYLLCLQCRTMDSRLREEAYQAQYGTSSCDRI